MVLRNKDLQTKAFVISNWQIRQYVPLNYWHSWREGVLGNSRAQGSNFWSNVWIDASRVEWMEGFKGRMFAKL